jgi:hypothetical protein
MYPFTDIVSLGYRCRTARRLRDHFGFETAYPFDWWISPLKALVRVLEEWDPDRLFDVEELRETRDANGIGEIKHVRYGVKFLHDFPRRDGYIVEEWREHLPEVKSRTAHLMARFDALDSPDRRILFCREYCKGEDSELHYRLMRKALRRRLPLARRGFILVSPAGFAPPGWGPVVIDDPLNDPWSGDPKLWDPALAALGYAHTPVEEAAAEPGGGLRRRA